MKNTNCEVEEMVVKDIDMDADVLESPEYAEDIDAYLRKCEVSYWNCERKIWIFFVSF